jgi:pilus assembly protein CpaE
VDNRFVFVTRSEERFLWLSEALAGSGATIWDKGEKDTLLQLIGSIGVRVVFLDFNRDAAEGSAALAEELLRVFPSLWLVGVGADEAGAGVLAAMRVGCREFIRADSPAEEIRAAVQRRVEKTPPLPAVPRGRLLAMLGARPGVGTTAAAVHAALMLKAAAGDEVLLLDCGFPQGDASLYLDTKQFYSFADALRSARRFDHALIKTAFVRHPSGLAVLPLPQNLAELQGVSPSELLNLLALLKFYFRYIVADLGGFLGIDFMLHVLGMADATLLVCEQNVPACHSAAQLLKRLEDKGYDHQRIGLVIGKHDARMGMPTRQVAKLLDLELRGQLPNRPYVMVDCINEGKSLLDRHPDDSYLRAMAALLGPFTGAAADRMLAREGGALAGLRRGLRALLGREGER